jgi:hypothetical protein
MTVLASGFDTLEAPAFDRHGNLFFVDWVRHAIMRRSPSGEVREFFNTAASRPGWRFTPMDRCGWPKKATISTG